MKSHPIIFNGKMVRAILDGRKIQTRRVINRLINYGKITELEPSTTKGYSWSFRDRRKLWHEFRMADLLSHCPHGQIGDHLWVRESYFNSQDGDIYYKADNPDILNHLGTMEKVKWTSVIYIPKNLSRITIEIINVRVERLQEITIEDCVREGLERRWTHKAGQFQVISDFLELWDSINAKRGYSWTSNPWVWVIEFKRI